ncbi:MAG TPA: DEAD/DEAH box helicase [Flavobacteriales bacterium]|nr:DEAD/DEAH box helicase [Flavobacteriales bacterium]HPH82722.1 DEAD/DEAH box helicase [Flavobacteriales bacterium]
MSKSSFSDLNLNTPLLNAINDLGFEHPTPIQERAFSAMMAGNDVVGLAQTGTGKTIAYLLPCLRLWKFSKDKLPQTLILVPTRELVVQVVEEITKLATYMNITAVGVYGGANIRTQKDAIHKGLDILVATPGRLLDLALDGTLKTKTIKRLVIDEVDEMLSLGFRPQLERIFDVLPPKRQTLMFSATLSDDVDSMISTYFRAPIRIEAAPAGSPLDNISQTVIEVPNYNTKLNLLNHLLSQDNMDRVLLFAGSRKLADKLYEHLEAEFPTESGIIHSNKAQNTRFRAVENFAEGKQRILIATDILSRGIDITGVSHVINFDVPDVMENYIHRIGRTGRADAKGDAITFVMEKDAEMIESIEELMQMNIERLPIPEEVEISSVLTLDELPHINMPGSKVKKSKYEPGPAFHEKKDKNKKVNVRKTRAQQMREKYNKPRRKG